jgi:probable F420-dependent oxidoreductase
MKVETALPTGKVDPGLRKPDVKLDIRTVSRDAHEIETMGYDGLALTEDKSDPFIGLTLAAEATGRLNLTSSVAIAFTRSPTTMALSAWTLQKLSNGRFTLGLGSQVKGHIERRYGIKWSAAAPWMREYILALRAVWDSWQNGTRLDFHGQHYDLTLMIPQFNPGPIEHPRIPIHVAAVNRYMCQVAGEVSDGVRAHPICTRKYMQEVMLPAVRQGATKTGRPATDIAVCVSPLLIAAADEAGLEERVRNVRARIAFYASTPTYRAVFDLHGWGDVARELTVLSKQQRWEEMPPYVSDDMLETIAVTGTYDHIAERVWQRYSGIATHVQFGIPVRNRADRERLREIVSNLKQR